ncbi:MAG: glycosyltransferase family 1 protein, partial [Gemmatimonadales bacterium]
MKGWSDLVRDDRGDGSLTVVHLCAPAGVGGLERVVQGLTTGLDARGHRVTLMVVVSPGVDLTDLLAPVQRAGVRVVTIRSRGWIGTREMHEIRTVRRELAAIRPDVVHTHGYRSDLLHGWHLRCAGIAAVTTLHGSSRMGGLSHLFEYAQLSALRHFDAVIAVSRPLYEKLQDEGVPGSRLHEIPNAWTPPTDPFDRETARKALALEDSDDPVAIAWVGRLIPIKGCDVFLEALAEVRADGWEVRIVGDGPERAALEAQADRLGLRGRVQFMGAIPDAARYLAAFDLFVLSSRSEGTPMVLLEAMGAGLPAIATDVGGVPDVLPRPTDGWVVPSEAPHALARSIERVVRSAELRKERRSASLIRVHQAFDFSEWVVRHEVTYRTAVAVRSS